VADQLKHGLDAAIDRVVNDWVYSWPSIIGHTAWFAALLVLALDINVLTAIVSLEAIYLCLFIGQGQRRHAAELTAHITATATGPDASP